MKIILLQTYENLGQIGEIVNVKAGYARNFLIPNKIASIATDDNVQLRNLGIIAVEQGILKLSGDNRAFSWASNNRKLFNVPFDEHPYSALAAWFKTDDGLEVFKSIEKKLK